MLIFIRGLSGAVTPLHVSPHESVLSIKIQLFYLKGIPISDQHLLYMNEELSDQTILALASIGHGALLRLVLGLRTGPLNRPFAYTSNLSYLHNRLSSSQCTISSDNSHHSHIDRSPTIVFPFVCIAPIGNELNNHDNKHQQSSSTQANQFGSPTIVSHTSLHNLDNTDDEINQIAEFLGYAIDESEQLDSIQYYTTHLSSGTIRSDENVTCDTNYYSSGEHFNCSSLMPSSGMDRGLHNSEHMDSTLDFTHGLKVIEAPSERCQSFGSLISPTIPSTCIKTLRSPCIRDPCSSSPNVNYDSATKYDNIEDKITSSSNNLKPSVQFLCENSDLDDNQSETTDAFILYPVFDSTISSESKPFRSDHNLFWHQQFLLSTNFPSHLTSQMRCAWVSSPSLPTTHSSSMFESKLIPNISDLMSSTEICTTPKIDSFKSEPLNAIDSCSELPNSTYTSAYYFSESAGKCHSNLKHISHSNTQISVDQTPSRLATTDNNDQTVHQGSFASSVTASRCFACNKRTRPACGFSCRCERWFCARHHHPEDHRCDFNFKTLVHST